ncbi:MAG: TonB family protein [Arenicellaceae bacterium]|nr:TonB family protein [Arenicellaceae bacterium]
MVFRSLQSFAFASVIMLSLLFAMNALISMNEPELGTKDSFKLPDFVYVPKNEDPQTITPKPDRPEDIQDQPDTPEIDVSPDIDINSDLSLGMVRVGIDKNMKGFNSNDGEYLPIFRAPPIYPRRAQERGLCGWVELEYTVTASGGTRDPYVTASSSGMFESAATKAAAKYKYKPRQVGGKPVDVTNVPIRIVFEMEEGC